MRFSGLLVALLLAIPGCVGRASTEAVEALAVEDLVSYWGVLGVDRDGYSYIRPAVRFRIRNGGPTAVSYIQAHVTFRRLSAPDEAWGTGYLHSVSEGPLDPGDASVEVTLHSDSNYLSQSTPERMFDNPLWEDVEAEVFLRVGSSSYTSRGRILAQRRLGPPGVEKFLEPDEEEPIYEVRPREREAAEPSPGP